MEHLKINVNGTDKLASGLNKDTTVQDLKFAMLYSCDSKFNPNTIDQYGLFEQWQSNERLLDSAVKMYKIIKTWKKMPGDQLSQVKFVIKKKFKASSELTSSSKPFKFCSLSPSVQKTWNLHLIQKNKTSYVRKQLGKLNQCMTEDENRSMSSIPSTAWSSANEDSDSDCEQDNRLTRKRYASIHRINRSRNCSVKRMTPQDQLKDYDQDHQRNKLEQIKKLKNKLQTIKSELTNSNVLETKEDDMTLLKTNTMQSLELELRRLCEMKCSRLSTSDSLSSFGSVDTGIGSAFSDDDGKFETLV
ncbi:hypothetical protein BpHYR1_023073 [Brachionus plicatilis]|uniref:Uncharacterized protein n=1 Tax=Brachionus plicatilis TaxID=10195 RepID=A0A3M7PHX4_BRAPC|nr:hypothetical protein BpHYR1_023073 [Brachionus plicatilis]